MKIYNKTWVPCSDQNLRIKKIFDVLVGTSSFYCNGFAVFCVRTAGQPWHNGLTFTFVTNMTVLCSCALTTSIGIVALTAGQCAPCGFWMKHSLRLTNDDPFPSRSLALITTSELVRMRPDVPSIHLSAPARGWSLRTKLKLPWLGLPCLYRLTTIASYLYDEDSDTSVIPHEKLSAIEMTYEK